MQILNVEGSGDIAKVHESTVDNKKDLVRGVLVGPPDTSAPPSQSQPGTDTTSSLSEGHQMHEHTFLRLSQPLETGLTPEPLPCPVYEG